MPSLWELTSLNIEYYSLASYQILNPWARYYYYNQYDITDKAQGIKVTSQRRGRAGIRIQFWAQSHALNHLPITTLSQDNLKNSSKSRKEGLFFKIIKVLNKCKLLFLLSLVWDLVVTNFWNSVQAANFDVNIIGNKMLFCAIE